MTDCCNGAPATCGSVETQPCPACHRPGKPVARGTVQALVRPELRDGFNGETYCFCETPTCPVVYYAGDGVRVQKQQLRVRVGLKETDDPIPVCYCFDVTERMIREEIQQTGRSTASARIRAEIKAENCRCEVENPSGRCCLGDVLAAEKRAASECGGKDAAFAYPRERGANMCPSVETPDRVEPLATKRAISFPAGQERRSSMNGWTGNGDKELGLGGGIGLVILMMACCAGVPLLAGGGASLLAGLFLEAWLPMLAGLALLLIGAVLLWRGRRR